MTKLEERAGRRCHGVINPLHSALYFSPDLNEQFAEEGVNDRWAAYLSARSAPLGAVGAGTVAATFYSFHYPMIAERLPAVWESITPAQALRARAKAVDATLRRLLGEDGIAAKEVAETAELALRAAEACDRGARPLYAANADLPVPDEPHMALWHAATLLREHRGDGHLAVLMSAGLTGIQAQATHTASGKGLGAQWAITTRGYSQEEWDETMAQLRERGLVQGADEGAHTLTEEGVRLRRQIEAETDRLDQAPYEHLGATGVERLTELASGLTLKAAESGAFPKNLLG